MTTNAPKPPETITVYFRLREEERTCDMGCTHPVGVWVTKQLTKADRTVPGIEEWSGEPLKNQVWVDRQGRDYECVWPTDYYGAVRYIRQDKVVFQGRVTDQIAVDALGRRITP